MIATYTWKIEQIIAKKIFTDKNNNVRENVIKDIRISYVGKYTQENGKDEEKKETITVSLNIFNLSTFKPIEDLSEEEILTFALNELNPKEKERIEKSVITQCGDLEEESNLITIILNDEQSR